MAIYSMSILILKKYVHKKESSNQETTSDIKITSAKFTSVFFHQIMDNLNSVRYIYTFIYGIGAIEFIL